MAQARFVGHGGSQVKACREKFLVWLTCVGMRSPRGVFILAQVLLLMNAFVKDETKWELLTLEFIKQKDPLCFLRRARWVRHFIC